MKRLILIRHGETDYTLQEKYCGHENVPLNARGVEQARCLRRKLKNMKIDTIYSSDLKRAFQTAKIVFQDRTIFKEKKLREINFGQFSGLTFAEANRTYPDLYKMWLNNPINTKIPGGENLSGLAKRVQGCFKKISNRNSERTVVLVSHGGPIRIILLKMLKQNCDKFWHIKQDIAAVNIIDFKSGNPKILRINDTSHLD